MKKILTIILLLCLLVGCLGCTQPVESQPQGQFIVHFIDLGQSDSILLEYEGHYALIDGGYAETSDKLLDYLENESVEKLDLVVSTHMHGDHIGARTIRREASMTDVAPTLARLMGIPAPGAAEGETLTEIVD